MQRSVTRALAQLLLMASISVLGLSSGCGGGGSALPGPQENGAIAPENDNQGSFGEIAEENENQSNPALDEPTPTETEEEEEDAEDTPTEYDFSGDTELGTTDGAGPLEQLKIVPLTVGENIIDHRNYARSGGFNIETKETFAGRELYLEAAYVEYDLVGLQEHWAIEAIEVRGFGNAVAGFWSSEFGYFWENSTMYLDADSTVLQFFPNDHIDGQTGKLRLRTWNYSDTMDAAIYEVRIYVKNNAVLTQADNTELGPLS